MKRTNSGAEGHKKESFDLTHRCGNMVFMDAKDKKTKTSATAREYGKRVGMLHWHKYAVWDNTLERYVPEYAISMITGIYRGGGIYRYRLMLVCADREKVRMRCTGWSSEGTKNIPCQGFLHRPVDLSGKEPE